MSVSLVHGYFTNTHSLVPYMCQKVLQLLGKGMSEYYRKAKEGGRRREKERENERETIIFTVSSALDES